MVVGLGFEKKNSKILLTLIVAKHPSRKCRLVLLSSYKKEMINSSSIALELNANEGCYDQSELDNILRSE